MKPSLAVAVLSLASCEAPKASPPSGPASAPVLASASSPVTAGEQSFGAKLSDATPFVALADIYKDPQAFAGKRVRTRGEVVAVCQAAGCWCDLRPLQGEGGKPSDAAVPTHVMMHDHAFLLPKTAKSKVADIEGTLVVRALSQSEVDHYNAEGASLVAGTPMVNVDAVGVVLR
ncbi:MAG: DUF4920 domain-containing protein [Polyangiales bacterium]